MLPRAGHQRDMDYTLCNISALRYYRTPPLALMMLPPITICEADNTRRDLRANPTIAEVINSPIHMLVASDNHKTGAVNIKHHVWSTKQPKDAIWDTVLDIKVTSPLFTLLTLAPLLSIESLALIIYELSGNFTVFKPSESLEEMLKPYEEQLREGSGGWRRVYSTDGKPGDLWMRSPLIDFDELDRFLEETRGMYGHKRLAQATQMVTGIVSSPFEAQLSMLLNTPRSKGGEGLASISNNHEVALTAEARKLCHNKKAFIDLYVLSDDGTKDLAIECQGRSIHGTGGVKDIDADRATALECMGIDVLMVTYQQISEASKFDALRRLIFQKLGMTYKEKTPRQKAQETKLRQMVFLDWKTLGAQELKRTRKKNRL